MANSGRHVYSDVVKVSLYFAPIYTAALAAGAVHSKHIAALLRWLSQGLTPTVSSHGLSHRNANMLTMTGSNCRT